MKQASCPLAKIAAPDPTLVPLPAFSDNYIWLHHDHEQAIVVDPGQAEPVLRFLDAHHLRLQAILLTHHHYDHVGGVKELVNVTHATVYGPAGETLPYCDVRLREGDCVTLPELDLAFEVHDVPGHTSGHIAYFNPARTAEPPGAPSHVARLFCGDTLFAGGCGRLFEGTAAQMQASLGKLANLPPDTKVYCAHEYTLSNLRWALTITPHNLMLQQWYQRAQQLQALGQPTLPSSLWLEQQTNLFLRTDDATLIAAVKRRMNLPPTASLTPVDVFAHLREWKNNWKDG